MTTAISLPTGSWVSDDKRASGRRLVNCFSEIAPQTGALDLKSTVPPAYLRRMFGISPYARTEEITAAASSGIMTAGTAFGLVGYNSDPSNFTFGTLSPALSVGGSYIASLIGNGSETIVEIGDGTLTSAPTAFSFSFTDENSHVWTYAWDGTNFTQTTGPYSPTITVFGVSSGYWAVGLAYANTTGHYPTFVNAHTYTINVLSGGTSSASSPPVRGIRTMAGITYVVIGDSLYTMVNNGNMTAPATTATLTKIASGITGSGFVRLCDNTKCLFILVPNTNQGYTYTVANGLQQMLDETFLFYGAKDVWFIDTYMVFLALNGIEFYNDDGQVASGTGPITFTTGGVFPREFGTDEFVGMCVDHRTVHMFGELTSEGYVDAGNATESPFAAAPDAFMQIGCNPHCGYTVALQDQSVFWVANDLTVRRLNGQTPVRVSNSGIEALLEDNKFLLYGAYALTPTIGGHPLWVLTLPLAGKTVVYDCLTTEWFDLSSDYNDIEYWRPLCWYNAHGLQLVGDSQFSQIGYLDERTFTEWGQPMVAQIYTQSIYDNHNRITHERVEAVVTTGQVASAYAFTITAETYSTCGGGSSTGYWDSVYGAAIADDASGGLGSISPAVAYLGGYQVAAVLPNTIVLYGNVYANFTITFNNTAYNSAVGTRTYSSGFTTYTFSSWSFTAGNNYTFYVSNTLSAGAAITLFKSDDAGYTWVAREGKPLGPQGSPRPARAVWWRLGQSRDRAYLFQISDPTQFFMVAIVAELSGGRW